MPTPEPQTPVRSTNRRRRVDHLLVVRAARDPGPEGEVARNMLERRRAEEAALPEDERLAVIADDIRAAWGRGIEAQFEIGRLLHEAMKVCRRAATGIGTNGPMALYGRWLRAQNLPFGKRSAYDLRIGYEREDEVRALIGGRTPNQRDIGVVRAIQLLTAKPKPSPAQREAQRIIREALAPDEPTGPFATWVAASEALIPELHLLPDDERDAVARMLGAIQVEGARGRY
jgi:hypothetical protein